jgi:hypothetical protein
MIICPKCKIEYREGYKFCSDCKEELIEIPDDSEKDIISKNDSLKKTLIGIALLISSALAYVGISISATIYGAQLTEWHTDKGKIGTALTENALLLFPCIITIIMFIIGIAILFSQYYSKTDK